MKIFPNGTCWDLNSQLGFMCFEFYFCKYEEDKELWVGVGCSVGVSDSDLGQTFHPLLGPADTMKKMEAREISSGDTDGLFGFPPITNWMVIMILPGSILISLQVPQTNGTFYKCMIWCQPRRCVDSGIMYSICFALGVAGE